MNFQTDAIENAYGYRRIVSEIKKFVPYTDPRHTQLFRPDTSQQLIMPEPGPDCSELEPGEEARSAFVWGCGQVPEMSELVEESLDQVALFVGLFAVTMPPRRRRRGPGPA